MGRSCIYLPILERLDITQLHPYLAFFQFVNLGAMHVSLLALPTPRPDDPQGASLTSNNEMNTSPRGVKAPSGARRPCIFNAN